MSFALVPGNATWRKNDKKILEAYSKLLKETGRVPTYDQIAAEAGVSKPTVYEHFKWITLESGVPTHKGRLNEIMTAIGNAAALGDPRAAKLWLQVVMGFNERTIQDVKQTITNDTVKLEIIDETQDPEQQDDDVDEEAKQEPPKNAITVDTNGQLILPKNE
jgi:hypothetical protein